MKIDLEEPRNSEDPGQVAYEDAIRVRVHDSDWQELKVRAIREGGTKKFQEVAGDHLAKLARSSEWKVGSNEQVRDWRSVWIKLPVDAREDIDKLRASRADATWARMMNAALNMTGKSS